jgi:hypothetical protein
MKFPISDYFKILIIGVSAIVFFLTVGFWSFSSAATNIDSTYKYAWNDVIGWIDFASTTTVMVSSTQLDGYAYSSVGSIALNCATSPTGNCSIPYAVSNNSTGSLSGWAWNDAIGWISFDSVTATSSYSYQVTVDVASGDFSGWAWNDIIGWISFNCSNTGTCGASNYKVSASWRSVASSGTLDSSIFDTQIPGGVAFNSVMWQGYKPAGTNVKFQIATDSTSTPAVWNYLGPDGSSATYYEPSDANVAAPINTAYHNNKRYFRYKIYLQSDINQTLTPRVDDVVINWSP